MRSNPEERFISLMDTYMGLVYTIVKNKLCSVCRREDIEECVSAVFYDLYRQYNKEAAKTASLEDSSFEDGSLNSPVDTETKHLLIQGIKELGEPDSEIFMRKYYLGQSTLVISKILRIKANTIDKKISRGLVCYVIGNGL